MLHVANGSCTTRLIEAAGIPGRLSIWADPLYEGPVPGDVSDDELIRIRARYLSGGNSHEVPELVAGLHGWRDALDEGDAKDGVVLWFEHDLFDQLNLTQLLSWVHRRPGVASNLTLIEIGAFPDHPSFKGLGELSPTEISSLFPRRVAVRAERYEIANSAWSAFRHKTPERLNEFLQTDSSAMPFLRDALSRLQQEYPWTTDGLSRTERQLLDIVSGGPVDLLSIFSRLQEKETAYFITDLSLLSLLRLFSAHGLISLNGESLDATNIPEASAAITERGAALLSGRADRVGSYGIDRWIGGVHLTSERVWRFDPQLNRVR
jgi:hypothetical protein